MIPHNAGYIVIILAQQLMIVGLIWSVMRLMDRLRREDRRNAAIKSFSRTAASNDLAALAMQLSDSAGNASESPMRPVQAYSAEVERS